MRRVVAAACAVADWRGGRVFYSWCTASLLFEEARYIPVAVVAFVDEYSQLNVESRMYLEK